MAKLKNKRVTISVVALLVILVAYFPAKPHINRLLDNRERATMSRHGLLIKEKIQALARKDGIYPSEERAEQLIQTSGLTSPHTNKTYEFIGSIGGVSQVKDSQIAYGLGEYKSEAEYTNKAYFCIGISLPRTNEGGASCESLSLDGKTDMLIKYGLSCKTNWLGFSTGCDKNILQDL